MTKIFLCTIYLVVNAATLMVLLVGEEVGDFEGGEGGIRSEENLRGVGGCAENGGTHAVDLATEVVDRPVEGNLRSGGLGVDEGACRTTPRASS